MECVKLYLGCLMMLAFVFGTLGADCHFREGVKWNACFADHGLQAQQTVSGGVSIAASLGIQFDTDVCSSKQSNLIETLRCLLQIYQDCGFVPSPEIAGDIVKFECEQIGKVDMNCISESFSNDDTNKCEMQETEFEKDRSQMNITEKIQIWCADAEISYKCAKPALEQCGSAEVKYVAKYVTGSFRPEACGESTDSSAAILAHPDMLCLSLFAIMLRFFMA